MKERERNLRMWGWQWGVAGKLGEIIPFTVGSASNARHLGSLAAGRSREAGGVGGARAGGRE